MRVRLSNSAPSDFALLPRSTSLVSVTIPAGVTEIAKEAFSGCMSLASVMLPGGLKKICTEAFSNCPALKSVTIPSAAKVETGVFDRKCKRLKA